VAEGCCLALRIFTIILRAQQKKNPAWKDVWRWDRVGASKVKMSDAIALVCAECGATVMRHPAMRLRRVVYLECVQKAKNNVKRVRR
jgi:ribosomal protein L44E